MVLGFVIRQKFRSNRYPADTEISKRALLFSKPDLLEFLPKHKATDFGGVPQIELVNQFKLV